MNTPDSKKEKILVIAPHADDEVLGCGGYLYSEMLKGSEIVLLIGTIGGINPSQTSSVRYDEFKEVCRSLKANGKVIIDGKDAELDTVSSNDIVGRIDQEIRVFKPTKVFVNYSSHHQDHKKTYECAMAALRLKEGYMPPFVALYEYPFVNGVIGSIDGGRLYHNITDTISHKCRLFSHYGSQAKSSPSPLNEDGIKALAKIRGVECGVGYAELFYIQKMML